MNQSVKDQKINNLIALYSQGEITRAISEAQKLTKVYKKEPFLFNFLGVASVGIGSIDTAVKYYKEALSLNPQYYEVYNNIGLAYNDLKKPNVAIKYLNKAIQIFPDYAEAYNNIGNTQKELGNTSEAVENYKKAISINPNYVDAYTNLGIVHSVLDEFDEAEKAFKKALGLDRKNINILFNYANCLFDSESTDLALNVYREITAIEPNFYFAYNKIGLCYLRIGKFEEGKKNLEYAIKINPKYIEAINNLGLIFQREKDYLSAIKQYETVLQVNKDSLEAYNNLSKAYLDSGKLGKAKEVIEKGLQKDEKNIPLLSNLLDLYLINRELNKAEDLCKILLSISPKSSGVYNALGSIAEKKGNFTLAKKRFETALSLNPKNPQAHVNIAAMLQHAGEFYSAIEAYEKVINKHDNLDARYNSSEALLAVGEFKKGWMRYDFRWEVFPANKVKWPFAREEMWNNEEGKRVSLWKEQGIGDEIIFLGLVPEAKERSQSLAVYIDPRLVPLCDRSMPGIKFFGDTKEFEKQAFDYHMPMGSLPRLFRSDIKDFDRTAHGYLKADKLRVDILRREMGLEDKRVIGISWKSIRSLTTSKKSMMLKDFGMMFKGMDVVLLNLQYGDVQEEIDEFTQATGIEILQCESVDNREDLDGLAALIELCDLVVSTSNITIHLAGALGKETWVLLPYVANFWWLLDRTDSIWYPALRLYRQKTLDDWGGVLSNINKDLQKKFGE